MATKRMSRIEKLGRRTALVESGCWEWQSIKDRNGYGNYTECVDGKATGRKASRAMWEETIGPIPEGLELDHLCKNTSCVNPEHLEPVTHKENIRRRDEFRTHCKSGHEFNEQNTYHDPNRPERRDCRTCRRAAVARHQARRRIA